MAEQDSSNALVPSPATGYQIVVKEYDAAGKKTELSFPLPSSANFSLWSLEQQIGMLKRGMWAACSIPDILWGLAYAHRIDADPIKGEVFPTGQGRWGTSNKYKLRKALETGNIVGIQTDIADLGTPLNLEKCIQKTDLECTVTITVKGWAKPLVRKARLSRWYKAQNPNWQGNPEHMLELNTVAHACEYVLPGATEEDEAPPLVPTNPAQEALKALGLLKLSPDSQADGFVDSK